MNNISQDEFEKIISETQKELHEAINKGGLYDDPLRYPLAALSKVLGIFPKFINQINNSNLSNLQILPPEYLNRIETTINKELQNNIKTTRRIKQWKLISYITGGIIFISLLCGYIGYWQGYNNGSIKMLTSINTLPNELKRNPKTALIWLNLIQANDIEKSLTVCHGDRINTAPNGQKGCDLPLWITLPNPPKE